MTKFTKSPKIWVGCPAAYNNGYLHGSWINLEECNFDIEIVQKEIDEILKTSPIKNCDEWEIFDKENCPYNTDDLESLLMDLEIISISDFDPELIAEVQDNLGHDKIEDTLEFMEENYLGEFESVEDYAISFIEDCYGKDFMPKGLEGYFDYEGYAKELENGGDIFTVQQGYKSVHIFSNR